jgi:hypothetical protein
LKTYISLSFLLILFGNGGAFAGGKTGDRDSVSTVKSTVTPVTRSIYPLGLKAAKTRNEVKESKYKRWTKLKYSGYIRSYNQYRQMAYGYPATPENNLLTVNGLDIRSQGTTVTGYQEPLFLLRLEGAATAKTFFKVETLFDNQMWGIWKENTAVVGVGGASAPGNKRTSVYRIFEFTAKTSNKLGSFVLTSGGGVIWKRLSPFTYWNYEYRDDMFERYPWEPEGSPWGRYNQFYSVQNISRDARWGNTGTQGFVLDGSITPLQMGFTAIYGKTDNSGGFQTYLSRTPKNVVAGKIDRAFGKHKIGINYFNQFGYTDGLFHNLYLDTNSSNPGKLITSSKTNEGKANAYVTASMLRTRQQILTADGRLNFDKIRIYTEAGMGRYQDSLIEQVSGHYDTVNAYLENTIGLPKSGKYYVNGLNNNWGHAFNFQAELDRSLTFIPLSFQFFSISKSVVNINSAVLNSANPHALADLKNLNTSSDNTTMQGALTEITNQQMTNNRWGLRLKHEDAYIKGNLKLMAALDMQQEHENLFNTITFQHQANAFTRSRFGYFQQYLGPYGRIVNLFRRSFEKVAITDSVVDYKKSYNSAALWLKYKFNIFNKEFIISSFSNYNSVQDKLSPIPLFTDKAFLRAYYQEFLGFYAIHPRVTLLGLFALEKNVGNKRTFLTEEGGKLIDENTTPGTKLVALNQIGHSYGLGLDYDLSNRAGLFIRHRWFDFKDVNQKLDKFKGQETSIELKIFF